MHMDLHPVEGQLRDHNTEHCSPRLPIMPQEYILSSVNSSKLLYNAGSHSALTFYYLARLSFTTVKRTDWRSLTRCSPCKNQQLSPLNRRGSCSNAPVQNQTAWLQIPDFIVLCCPNLKRIVLGLDGETILCLNPKQDGKPVCSHLALCSEGFLSDETCGYLPIKEAQKPGNLKYLVEPHPP